MTERSREEASKLERQIAEDHSHQGANELLEQLQRVGQFLRDAEGQVHYYREATGALYEVNTKPRSAFGRLLTFLMPALTGRERHEQIEEMMTFFGWEATPMRLAVHRHDQARRVSIPPVRLQEEDYQEILSPKGPRDEESSAHVEVGSGHDYVVYQSCSKTEESCRRGKKY
jgi:hypothetical protein